MSEVCKWCKEEGSSLHSSCEGEMGRGEVRFTTVGIYIKDERMTVILHEGDNPRKEYVRIRQRDETKLTLTEMKNKWLEPIDKFIERYEKDVKDDKITTTQVDNEE